MRPRAAAVALLAAPLLGCGGGGGNAGTPTSTPPLSGIDVLTVAGPTCPVQRAGESCTAPISATVVVTQGGATVARVQTSSNGRGHIPLRPGGYTVSGEASSRPFPRPPGAQQVTVPDRAFVAVQISFDTGIR